MATRATFMEIRKHRNLRTSPHELVRALVAAAPDDAECPSVPRQEISAVAAPALADVIAEYGCNAYLLTVAEKSPHTSFVSVTLESGVLRCVLGNSAAKNIALAPNVSLFWPPLEPNGYALIVNGSADGQCDSRGVTTATIMPSKCVLHRAGPKPLDSDGPCASDCRRVRLAAGPQIAHAVQRPD